MNKQSTILTTDLSPSDTKARSAHTRYDDKQSDLNSNSPKESLQKQNYENSNQNISPESAKRKLRRPSFIQLQTDTQIKMQNMIRDDILMHRKVNRKMSLDIDQTCLCTSDIYTKDQIHWRNRQISQLTTKKFDSIPIESTQKIKVLNEQPMTGYNLFRVTIGDKDIKDFAIRMVDVPQWFSNSIWMCLVSSGCQTTNKVIRQFQGQIQGEILKKSQFLGNWQLRYISISAKNGLISSKKKDCTASVRIKQTGQIWTRLQIITHQKIKYVIIKFWHMMFKYQFGIPITDCVRWSKAFSTLIK